MSDRRSRNQKVARVHIPYTGRRARVTLQQGWGSHPRFRSAENVATSTAATNSI